MLLQIANQVVANEITSGDYVDADDELSLKDTIANLINSQKENTAQFDDKMWDSVFWDPLDERPDRVTKEMNKFFKINQTDNRVYLTQSGTSSTSANVNILKGLFGGGGSHTSQSSMTQDQVRHLLEVYDIESDIEGEKFIPKKLDLMRLNMNDLTRHDAVMTKRVRVRQVDIGGVLQVAVGNSTLSEMEDENRALRRKLSDLEVKQSAMQREIEDENRELRRELTAMENEIAANKVEMQQQLQLTAAEIEQRASQAASQLDARIKSLETSVSTEHTGLMPRVCRLERLWNKLPYDVCG